jgi:hypothetical protein
VVIGWIIFRAENIHQAMEYLSGICSPSLLSLPNGQTTFLLSLPMFMVEWLGRRNQHALERIPIKNRALRIVFYYLIVAAIIRFGEQQSSFIYFQF